MFSYFWNGIYYTLEELAAGGYIVWLGLNPWDGFMWYPY